MASYNLLEPDITSSLGTKKLSFDTSNAVSLFATTEFLYMTAIMFIIGVAAFRLMLAGVWRIEASERGVRKSNEEIKRVSLGLIGVLSLFLILYTFNKGLLRGDVGLEGLRTKTGAGQMPVERATTTPQTTTGNRAAEKAMWNSLNSAGIRVVSTTGQTTPCTDEQLKQSKPTCVSLIDMPQAVTTMLIELKGLCPGNMQITGGTEPGHKTHGPRKAAVDVDDNDPQINSCIRKFPRGPNVGGWCKETFLRSGFIFCDENGTSHWHIFR